MVEAAGDRLGQADGGEVRERVAAGEGLAGEGDDRDSHPEGFARGHAAAVREGVQGDIDLLVVPEHVEVVGPARDVHAVRLDAVACQLVEDPLPGFGAVEALVLQ